MSGILCVWIADLPVSSEQWYEDEYIPKMMSSRSQRVLLSKSVEIPLDKDLERDTPGKSLAIYEIEDIQKAVHARHDATNHPAMLEGSQFEVRTYEEVKRWQQGDWNGDGADVVSVLLFEWQPRQGSEQQVVDFYQTAIGPMLSMAPEILRLRWFKVKNPVARTEDPRQIVDSENLYNYLSIAEMDCEEWPWGEIFALNDLPQWSEYFEGQKAVKWQAGHCVVKRSYPNAGDTLSNDG
ncbi:hypothetical protein EKO04_008110 [Ascochyta lentis]|uniref:Uncharacterized protein n=1 Tax=Ascochyta lentis TaxID=205686 RepID=A0A8H7MEN3_9PLEO|nr:hypothetical protein EKO04_008110 [Ascochyta lentis]